MIHTQRADHEQADGDLHRPRRVDEEPDQVELDRVGRGRACEEHHCPSITSTRRSRAQPSSSVPVASIAPRELDSVFALSSPFELM